MEKLKESFESLSKVEKIDFLKEIMPVFCEMFNEDSQGMMKEKLIIGGNK